MFTKDAAHRVMKPETRPGKVRVFVHVHDGAAPKNQAGSSDIATEVKAILSGADRRTRKIYDAKKLAADRANADAVEAGRIAAAKIAANAAYLAGINKSNREFWGKK